MPLGLLFSAGAYWLSLVSGWPLLFPALVALALLPLLRRPSSIELAADGPSLRGAWPAVAALVAVLAAAEYRANRVDGDGAFRLDVGEHVDTAVHVGVTWELVASYPPQVPGLAGVPMHYHVGTHLVRAAAARWAGIHPYDAISRFDVTLWGIALVLALRSAAHALGLGAAAVRLAGFVPLAADFSFVLGWLLHSPNAAMKLGGNFVEAVLFANSISPAMAAVLAAAVALVARGAGRGGRLPDPGRRARRRRRVPEGVHGRAAPAGHRSRLARAALAARARADRRRRRAGRTGARPRFHGSARRRKRARRLRAFRSDQPGADRLRAARGGRAGARALRPRVARAVARAASGRYSVRAPCVAAGRRGSGQPRRAGAHGLAVGSRPPDHGRPRLRRELLLPPGERARALALRPSRARRLLGGVAPAHRNRSAAHPAGHGRARGAACTGAARAACRRPRCARWTRCARRAVRATSC